MAIDYTKPTYSSPELGFDVPAYVKKYYEDIAAKKAEEESALQNQPEGSGIRSDQIYDSPDPKTRKAVGWGGGPFSKTEMDTGVGDANVTRYDQWGNEVDMGNRTWGIAFNKMLSKTPHLIPGYTFAKSIYDSQNKTGQTTASTDSTASTPQNLLVVDDTDDAVTTTSSTKQLPGLVTNLFRSLGLPNTGYNLYDSSVGYDSAGFDTTASGTTANPFSAEQGILDMLAEAAQLGDDEITAINMNAPGKGNVPF